MTGAATPRIDGRAPSRLIVRGARVLTLGSGPGFARGDAMRDVGVIDDADVVAEDGWITAVVDRGSTGGAPARAGDVVVEARGRVLMPAFVDAHTHLCWAGDRLDEWDRKLAGDSYLDILNAGGGIMSTVRDTRDATEDELVDLLVGRLGVALWSGTTAIEIKSGYGLNADAELRMLRAVQRASSRFAGRVRSTALIAHAIDPTFPGGREDFVRHITGDALDAVHDTFPEVPIDAYCEKGAWGFGETVELFERAMSLGHRVRVHTDQFNELGMTDWAIEHDALSVDHLEASSPGALGRVARSGTPAVLLPCSGFHVDQRYANGRALIDGGGAVVVATNSNPGSAPTCSMPMAIALAVRCNGLTPAEAICACTRNAAALLGVDDVGRVEPGVRADVVLLRHTDERLLAFEFGGDPVDAVVCGGELIRSNDHAASPADVC